MKVRFLTATAVAAIGAAAVLGESATSNAEEGEGDPPASPSDARLAELKSMDEVRDIGQSVDLQQKPGFGKVRLDFVNRQVHLYWSGEPPQDVQTLAGIQNNGVELVLADADYSQAEIIKSANQLLDEGRTKDGLPVQAAWPTEDLSGLIAMVKPSDLNAEDATRASSTQRKKLKRHLRSVADMPVQIVEGEGIVGTSRGNDSPPWQGGALMYNGVDDSVPCTTGFAVITGSGSGRLLSAGHCDNNGNRNVYDGTGNQVIAPGGATVDVRHVGIDSMIIDPSASPATIGKVYGGEYNQAPGTPRYEYRVGGSGSPQDNDAVCVSGANSGEHCRRIDDPVVVYRCPGNPDVNCTGFRFGGNRGTTTVAGDSGGPIYVERADGRVGARGLVSGGFLTDASPDCPPVADGPAYNCLQWAIGVSITNVLAYWRNHGHSGLRVEID